MNWHINVIIIIIIIIIVVIVVVVLAILIQTIHINCYLCIIDIIVHHSVVGH